jgi:hypothetical protein
MHILKKNNEKVNYENIFEYFEKKKIKGDIVAYYISKTKIDDIKSGIFFIYALVEIK